MNYELYFAAANYSCDAYGANAFGECSAEQPAPNPTTPTTNPNPVQGAADALSNTGYSVLLPIIFAIAVIGASVIFGIKKLRAAKN